MDERNSLPAPPPFLAQDPLWISAYRRFLPFWVNLAKTARLDEDEAKDIVHAVILSALTGATTNFESVEHIRNYVARAILNRAIEVRKASSRKSYWTDTLEFQYPVVEEHEEADDAVREVALRDALRRLPEREWQILRLRFYTGMTFMEISRMLGIPVSTLKSREDAAIKKIRKWLRKKGL